MTDALDNIELTPDMIDAGVDALGRALPTDTAGDVVELVYRAMIAAAPQIEEPTHGP